MKKISLVSIGITGCINLAICIRRRSDFTERVLRSNP